LVHVVKRDIAPHHERIIVFPRVLVVYERQVSLKHVWVVGEHRLANLQSVGIVVICQSVVLHLVGQEVEICVGIEVVRITVVEKRSLQVFHGRRLYLVLARLLKEVAT